MVTRLHATLMQEAGTDTVPYPEHNPLSKTGKEVLGSMRKQYGKKKGKKVFYASINKGKKGSSKWHK